MDYDFSTDLRMVLAQAREEAARLQSPNLGTEHLLLGVIRAAREEQRCEAVLATLGLDQERLYWRVMEGVMHGSSPVDLGDIRYTSEAKGAMELAMEESRAMSHDQVITAHLVLGLLRQQGLAATALDSFGIQLSEARVAIHARFPPWRERLGFWARMRRWTATARREAVRIREALQSDDLGTP